MNNRFPYNARQNRPPGQHPQRPHFNHNRQQPNQQQHLHMHQQQLLNPRAPQFHPHPTQQQPPHIPPAFNHNNNTGTWNAQPPPGFHHHHPTLLPIITRTGIPTMLIQYHLKLCQNQEISTPTTTSILRSKYATRSTIFFTAPSIHATQLYG